MCIRDSHRAEHFASTEAIAKDSRRAYTPQPRLSLNQWALGGSWKVGEESAVLQTAPGKIIFRFHARDLHPVSYTHLNIRYTLRGQLVDDSIVALGGLPVDLRRYRPGYELSRYVEAGLRPLVVGALGENLIACLSLGLVVGAIRIWSL